MNNKKNRCVYCNCVFSPAVHVKNQKYCSKKACQNARKNTWMRHKLQSDKDYKDNQKTYWNKWKKSHCDYWKRYRANSVVLKDRKKYKEKNFQLTQGGKTQLEIELKILSSNRQGVIECIGGNTMLGKLTLISKKSV